MTFVACRLPGALVGAHHEVDHDRDTDNDEGAEELWRSVVRRVNTSEILRGPCQLEIGQI